MVGDPLKLAFLFLIMIAAEWLFIRKAASMGFLDVPNDRSSHIRPVVRGGGIVIFLGVVAHGLLWDAGYTYLTIGVLGLGIIGIWDDRGHVPKLLRILVQAVAIGLLLLQARALASSVGPVTILLALLVATGALNAANFMDGINGMLVLYGLVMVMTLAIMNVTHQFAGDSLIWVIGLSLLVLSFFNVRRHALCFAGDVGSTVTAYVLIFLTVALIIKTSNPIYILFWVIYGIDTVVTIVERLWRRENIFEAHRSHLYQFLANERGWGHINVSIGYALCQALINAVVVIFAGNLPFNAWVSVCLFILPLLGIYVALKARVRRSLKYAHLH